MQDTHGYHCMNIITNNMSDIGDDSDQYLYDSLPDLHREGSLPDLVLSSSLEREGEFLPSLNLAGSTPSHVFDPPADIQYEYFTTGDQVTTSCGYQGIRVEYEDHSKLYIPKIRTCNNYRNYLNIAMPSDEESGDEPIQEEFLSLSPENQAHQREVWAKELELVNEELHTLDQQLRDKLRQAQSLKTKLGWTAWREFSEDLEEGMRKLKESPMIKKLEESLNETVSELRNLFISVDNFMLQTVDAVGDGVEKMIGKASEKFEKASRQTSEGITTDQQKVCDSLQKSGGSYSIEGDIERGNINCEVNSQE